MINNEEKFKAVECSKLTKTKIYFKCPFCWSNDKGKHFNSNKFKNGKISTRKPTIHNHGNPDGFLNRLERRSSHCAFYKGEFIIDINDNTIKEIPNGLVVNFD